MVSAAGDGDFTSAGNSLNIRGDPFKSGCLPAATNQKCWHMKSISTTVVFTPLSLSLPLIPAQSCCLGLPSFLPVFGEDRASGKCKRNTGQPVMPEDLPRCPLQFQLCLQ